MSLRKNVSSQYVLLINKIVENKLHCHLSVEIASSNCKQCFVQTVLQIVHIVLQNVLTKYVIVQVELNIIKITTRFVKTVADC